VADKLVVIDIVMTIKSRFWLLALARSPLDDDGAMLAFRSLELTREQRVH